MRHTALSAIPSLRRTVARSNIEGFRCTSGITSTFITKPLYISKRGDYPEDNEIIYVTGTFDTYTENGYTYCILREASLV